MNVAMMNPRKRKRTTRGKKTKGGKKGKRLTAYQQHMKTEIKTKHKTFKQAVASWHPKGGKVKVHRSKARRTHKVRRVKAHKVKVKARRHKVRRHKARKVGKVTAKPFSGFLATNPKRRKGRKKHKSRKHKVVHMPALMNPKRRKSGRKRRNPEYPTIGGGSMWSRIKASFTPHKPALSDFLPKWAEVKAHPFMTVGGWIIGGTSSAISGGIGRLIGGKNIPLSEAFGLIGNVLGFEVPARLLGLFRFKGQHEMVKGIRFGGIVTTLFSLLFGILRIATSVKKSGVKGLGWTTKPSLGAISLPKISEIPKAIVNTLGLGTIGSNNPLADAVTSGTRNSYFQYQPIGVSDSPGYQGTEYIGDPNKAKGTYFDPYIGDSVLAQKIKQLKETMGLSDADLKARMAKVSSMTPPGEMPGVGQVVPPMYSGGMSRDFIN
jgi:hypothetical protein